MKRILSLLILATLFLQCAPPAEKGKVREEEKQITISIPCSPTGLAIKPGNKKLLLKWFTNCAETVLLSGYNIYLLREPLEKKYFYVNPPSDIGPFNATPYPGDTDPNDSFETMEIDGLENGVEYFVSVRSVFPDGIVSASSNEVGVICRPEGEFVLAFRYANLNDGFSFARGISARADASANDIYFFDKDGYDFIASPDRLNGFLRKSGIFSLGKTKDIYQYPQFQIDVEPVEKMPVRTGESYLIKTADGNYAKIRIEDISGENKNRKLKIRYIYQTIKNLIRF